MVSVLNEDDYCLTLDAYYRNTDEVVRAKQHLHRILPLYIGEIFHIRKNSKPFNILAVGAGNGEYEIEVVNVVEQVINRSANNSLCICLHAIEPNKSQFEKLKSSPKINNRSFSQNVTFIFSNISLEEYLAKLLCGDKTFDLVLFFQCIYYFNIEETLHDVFGKLLHEHGKIIVVATEKDIVSSVFTYQSHLIPDEIVNINFRDVIPILEEIATKNKWRFFMDRQEYRLDVTSIFDEESSEGNMVLDSLTFIRNFRLSAPRRHVKETLQLIKSSIIEEKNGRLLCERNFNFIIISK